MIRRTFHIQAENDSIDVQEFGITVAVSIGSQEIIMTKAQFDELCSIKYDLKWDAELTQESLPF